MDGGAVATMDRRNREVQGRLWENGKEGKKKKKLEVRTVAVEIDGFPIAVAHGEGLRAEGG